MHKLNCGDWVLVDDHSDVPEWWRGTWGRVASRPENETPQVLIMDVMGRPLTVSREHVVRILHSTLAEEAHASAAVLNAVR